MYFQNIRRISVAVTSSNTKYEIELEEGAVPHREGARRMTPHKSEACRAEIELCSNTT